MSLSILNNIPSLVAQNQLAITNNNLKNTLFQLSSGSKINSGADDPAGLSISNGLQANISALTQSAQNVSNGVGMLQTADGALSQVTTLLNRAVTLATEAANTGLTASQTAALQNEFTSINAEINQIGSNTTYNNNAVFSGSAMSVFLSDGSAADAADPNIQVAMPTLSASALGLASYATGTLDLTANPTAGNTVQIGSQVYTFVNAGGASAAGDVALGTNVQTTLQNLQAAVNGGAGAGNLYGAGTGVNTKGTITSVNGGSAVVQALQPGVAGNSVTLSTSITSSVGSGGGTTLSGGVNASYDSGTLTLLNNPSLAAVAAGSITIANQPDTLTAASGVFSLANGQPTAGQTVTVGSQTYTFVASGTTDAVANHVAIGAAAGQAGITNTLTNLAAAINGTLTQATTSDQANLTGTDTGATGVSGASASYTAGTTQLTLAANTAGVLGSVGGANQVAFTSNVVGAAVPNGGPTGFLGGGTNADTVTVGATAYTFVANGTATAAGQVSLGTAGGGLTAAQNTLKNLMNAINNTAGMASVTTFGGAGATANLSAQATTISGNTLSLQALDGSGAILAGTGGATAYGNNAVLLKSSPDLAITVSGAGTLAGGTNNDTIQVGSQVYTFVAAGTASSSGGNQVALGATPQDTLDNLKAAVNAAAVGAGANGSYYVATVQAGVAAAQITSDANGIATVQSLTAGVFDGTTNNAAFSASFQNGNATGTFGGLTQATLSGGAAANKATGMIQFTSNAASGDTLKIGNVNYTFVASGAAAGATAGNAFVAIANTLQGTLANLQNAVNTAGAGSATTFSNNSTANAAATISSINGGQVVVMAAANGLGAVGANTGNYIALTATSANNNFTAGSAGGGAAAKLASAYLALNMNPTDGNTVTVGNVSYTFTSSTPTSGNQVALGQTINATLTNLQEAIGFANASSAGYGTAYSTTMAVNSAVTAAAPTGNQLAITAAAGATYGGANGNTVVLSANLSNGAGGGTVGTIDSKLSGGGNSVDLNSPIDAQTALTTIAAAIATVAGARGTIGSGINQMNAALQVMNNTAQNLTSSLSGIQDADIGKVVANMSKFQVLEQTGISALAQSNSQAQAVLKLLQ